MLQHNHSHQSFHIDLSRKKTTTLKYTESAFSRLLFYHIKRSYNNCFIAPTVYKRTNLIFVEKYPIPILHSFHRPGWCKKFQMSS